MKAIFGILAIYAGVCALGLVLYVASFRLPLGGDILFYRGLLLAGLVAAVLAVCLVLAGRKLGLDPQTIIGAVFCSAALNVCFLVLFPITIDRSISVYLLARIEAEPGMTADELSERFEDGYLRRMRQIDRRVFEQQLSGNITVTDGEIRMTRGGERFLAFARTMAVWFDTDRRFVNVAPPAVSEP
jgi:hypothetical protein